MLKLIKLKFIFSFFFDLFHFLLIFIHNFVLHIKQFIFKLSVFHVICSNCLYRYSIFNLQSWTWLSFFFNNFFFHFWSILNNILHNLLDRYLLDVNHRLLILNNLRLSLYILYRYIRVLRLLHWHVLVRILLLN